MLFKKSILVISLSLIAYFNQAQEIRELKVGDVVPDYEFASMVNHTGSKAKISDFRDKLLIIDFWATWCTPCIAAMPKLDSIQKKFRTQVQVLGITKESKKKVSTFLQSVQDIKNAELTTAVDDKLFFQIFKHVYLPHYVWIYKGKVLAFTDQEAVSFKNVESVINGTVVSFNQKIDNVNILAKGGRQVFLPFVGVLENNDVTYTSLNESDLLIHSVLTRFKDGLISGAKHDSTLVSIWNNNISSLYRIALFKMGMELFNQMNTVVEIKDSLLYETITGMKFQDPSQPVVKLKVDVAAWKKLNAYCYELKVPPQMADQKWKMMLEELNKYFGAMYGIEGLLENRNTKYLALVRTGTDDKLRSKENRQVVNLSKYELDIANFNMGILIGNLMQHLQNYPPLVDETGYREPIDLKITCDMSNLTAVNEALSKFGLRFVEKEKEMKVAVIRKIKQNDQQSTTMITHNP